MSKKSKLQQRKPDRKAKASSPKQKHPLGRMCPLGEHWVTKHPRNQVSPRGLAFVQSVSGYCRANRSGKDQLCRDEIQKIAERGFVPFKAKDLQKLKAFRGKSETYDALIVGWTLYWNQVFEASDPLDPESVKALIASESSFDPKKWNRQKGKNSAKGLMQVTNGTLKLLRDPKELKDHFLTLTEKDMEDPNLAICAGIRWLFRKKELAEAKLKRKVSWREAIQSFKGYKANQKEKRGMEVFDKFLSETKVNR